MSDADGPFARYHEADRLLASMLEMPPEERELHLATLSAKDPELGAAVGELLRLAEVEDDLLVEGGALAKGLGEALTGEASDSRSDLTGKQVGRWQIVRELGRGGMGEVWLAHDRVLDREVALKFPPSNLVGNPTIRRRLHREARAAAGLEHPAVCRVFELGQVKGQDFIVMEYLRGETLAERLARGRVPMGRALAWSAAIAGALEEAHDKGVIHRDLKPSNVMVTPSGEIKVMDFGLSRAIARPDQAHVQTQTGIADVTATGTMAGTPAYMVPEQFQKRAADERSDIWAFGCLLYEMLTGERAFAGESASEVATAILECEPDWKRLPAPTPPEIRRLLARCLRKEPRERLPELGEALRVLEDAGSSAPRRGALRRLRPAARYGIAAAGLVTLLVALLIGFDVGQLRQRLGGPSPAPSIESLAVLPFENLTGDPEQEYFVDGMTEALITELSRMGTLNVISRTSVMQYRDAPRALTEIARELGAQALVEGSAQREGEQVRIEARLMDGHTERRLWAETYEREMSDVLALQSQVALDIANQLRVVLTPQERAILGRRRQVDPRAYETYLWGRYFADRWRHEESLEAVELFERAIALDESFAAPHASLAVMMGGWGRVDRMRISAVDAFARAEEHALRALELDASLAEAHLALGVVRFIHTWDWVTAEERFQRALELDPNFAEAYHQYSHLLTATERHQDSLRAALRALKLDPLRAGLSAHLSWTYLYGGQLEQAVRQSESGLRRDPDFQQHHLFLGLAREQLGDHAGAIAALERAWEQGRHSDALAALGHAYAVAGDNRRAGEVLDRLEVLSRRQPVSPFNLAIVHLGLGDGDRALALLEQAYVERSEYIPYLNVDPRLETLRSDHRFVALVRRLDVS